MSEYGLLCTIWGAFRILVIGYRRFLLGALPVMIFFDSVAATHWPQHIVLLGCIAIGLTGLLLVASSIKDDGTF